jgi:hypothetical protein
MVELKMNEKVSYYFCISALSNVVVMLVLSLAYGVMVAGWHTWKSFTCALFFYLIITLILKPYNIIWTILGVSVYTCGWFIGLQLFPCNRGRNIGELRGQPWRYNCGEAPLTEPQNNPRATARGILQSSFRE